MQTYPASLYFAISDNLCGYLANDIYWYRKAAEQQYVLAQYNLGFMYANGRGVTQDDASALLWYERAAAQGDVDAQYIVAERYQSGRGAPADINQAIGWYQRALEQGHARAGYQLAHYYLQGLGVKHSVHIAHIVLICYNDYRRTGKIRN